MNPSYYVWDLAEERLGSEDAQKLVKLLESLPLLERTFATRYALYRLAKAAIPQANGTASSLGVSHYASALYHLAQIGLFCITHAIGKVVEGEFLEEEKAFHSLAAFPKEAPEVWEKLEELLVQAGKGA